MREKLSPRFIGPVEILECLGIVALPPWLAGTLDVLHMSILRKYVFDPSHIRDFTPLEFEEDLCDAPLPRGSPILELL